MEKEKIFNLLKNLYKVMNMTAAKVDVDVNYSKSLQKIHSDLLFLPGKMNICKFQKLVCNIYKKKKHIKALKQFLDYGLVL